MTDRAQNDVVNLDACCARCAHNMIEAIAPTRTLPKGDKSKVENTITKSLGVLQEQGVYAFFLFLDYFKSRGESKGADTIRQHTLALLQDESVQLLSGADYPALRALTEHLDNLLLARQLLERTLIYARYHAKALAESEGVAL